jgi:hypothetical protein
MRVVKQSLLFLGLALLLVVIPVQAEEYIFAFHDGTTATVYTTNTLEFVNSVEVGEGAVHAIGVPDPSQTQSLLKIFVIRTDAVVVLEPDPPFLTVKTHTLSGPISFGLPAIDADAAPFGHGVVFGFGGAGRIVHLDAGGTVKRADVIPAMPITGIAVIEEFAPFRSELQVYGGNEQFAAPGNRLTKPLSARLLSLDDRPLFRREITFTTELDTADITPTTMLTNMYGVAQATVVVPTLDPFDVVAATSPTLSATFNINSGGEGFDGLTKIRGDFQYAVSEEPFPLPLVVQAKLSGEPLLGLDLTIAAPPRALSVPTISRPTKTASRSSHVRRLSAFSRTPSRSTSGSPTVSGVS